MTDCSHCENMKEMSRQRTGPGADCDMRGLLARTPLWSIVTAECGAAGRHLLREPSPTRLPGDPRARLPARFIPHRSRTRCRTISVATGVPTRNSIGRGETSDGDNRGRQHATPGPRTPSLKTTVT